MCLICAVDALWFMSDTLCASGLPKFKFAWGKQPQEPPLTLNLPVMMLILSWIHHVQNAVKHENGI